MQFLVILGYSTISYSRLFHHMPLLVILCYFSIGYCWMFKIILPYDIGGRYFIGGYCVLFYYKLLVIIILVVIGGY